MRKKFPRLTGKRRTGENQAFCCNSFSPGDMGKHRERGELGASHNIMHAVLSKKGPESKSEKGR